MHKILQQRSLCQEPDRPGEASGQQAAGRQLVGESSSSLPATATTTTTTTNCLIGHCDQSTQQTPQSPPTAAPAANKQQASGHVNNPAGQDPNSPKRPNKAISNKQTKTLYTRRRIRSSIRRENSSSSSKSTSSSKSSSSKSSKSSSSQSLCASSDTDQRGHACRLPQTNTNDISEYNITNIDSDNNIHDSSHEQQTKEEINQFSIGTAAPHKHFNTLAPQHKQPTNTTGKQASTLQQANLASTKASKTKNKNKSNKRRQTAAPDIDCSASQTVIGAGSSGGASSNKQLITNDSSRATDNDCVIASQRDDDDDAVIDMQHQHQQNSSSSSNKKQLSAGPNSTKQQLSSLRNRYLLSAASRKRLTSLAMNIIGAGGSNSTANQPHHQQTNQTTNQTNQIKQQQQQHKSRTIMSILDTTKDYSKDNSSIIVLKSPTNAMLNRNGANSYHRDSSDADQAATVLATAGDCHHCQTSANDCHCHLASNLPIARQSSARRNSIDNNDKPICNNDHDSAICTTANQQQQRHTNNRQFVKVSGRQDSQQQQDQAPPTATTTAPDGNSANANLTELTRASDSVNSNQAKPTRSIKFGKVLTDMTIISDSTLGKFSNNQDNNSLVRKSDVRALPANANQTGPIKRENWDKNIEFLLAVVGFAVDLGNIWRFPYICYKNGGGAFLIPYMIMFLLGGLPVFYLEMSLGQYYASGCLTVWKGICPLVKGIGYAMCIINFFTGLYYNTIISWAVYFLFESFTTSELPWTSCNNPWNTDNCRAIGQNRNNSMAANSSDSLNYALTTMSTTFDDTMSYTIAPATKKSYLKSPTDEYFVREVLKTHLSTGVDDLGPIRWPLASYLAIVFIFVYFAIWKGVKSTGKAVWITALLPYFVLIPLLIRGVFLEGAAVGIRYYLYPDWSKLREIPVWIDAAKQVFFSLGPGFGTLLALSSYNKFNHNCFRDAIIAASVNCFTSFIAGFVIFSVLGYMATIQQQDISAVATDGPGLVFQVYPAALATMKGSSFWSILFFTMVISLGIDSTFGGLEAVITGLCDEYPRSLRAHRELFIGCLVIIIYICSLPTTTYGGNYVITVLDAYGTSLSLLFVVFLEAASVCWIFGVTRFSDKLEEMYGQRPGVYWRICWTYISPTLLLVIFLAAIYQETDRYTLLTMDDYRFPSWAVGLGWLMTASSLVCIPFYAIYLLAKTPGSLSQRFKKCITPIEKSKLTHDRSDSSCNQNEEAP